MASIYSIKNRPSENISFAYDKTESLLKARELESSLFTEAAWTDPWLPDGSLIVLKLKCLSMTSLIFFSNICLRSCSDLVEKLEKYVSDGISSNEDIPQAHIIAYNTWAVVTNRKILHNT